MKEKSYTNAVAENCKRIEEQIAEACVRAGRAREEVTLVGVSKTVEAERVQAAIDAGIRHLGENRVQELVAKQPQLRCDGVDWHLIGHLQTNKVKAVVGKVACIQSLDSLRLAQAIDRASADLDIVTPVLIELNIGEESSKSGIAAEIAADFAAEVGGVSHLKVEGLMCVPPICDDSTKTRRYFSKMHQLFLDIQAKKLDNVSMHILSMGMSSDFEDAILEGSTMVRVGTALFGSRYYP